MSWIREHRDGATAIVAKARGAGVYVGYATEPGGMVSMLVDDRLLDLAQAAADRAAGCPQPCGCPPWSEVIHRKQLALPTLCGTRKSPSDSGPRRKRS
jgi:hypothetical protein